MINKEIIFIFTAKNFQQLCKWLLKLTPNTLIKILKALRHLLLLCQKMIKVNSFCKFSRPFKLLYNLNLKTK